MNRPIAIVGGGLAGIAAAVKLVEAGERPIIIETRKRLGGRATSFVDPRTGETLDNCQHVLMGCCTNLIDLYDRIGVLDKIAWQRTLYWAVEGDEPDAMAAGPLPAPLHFAGSFRRMKLLSKDAKRAIRRAMWAILRKKGLSPFFETFLAFLTQHDQPEEAIARFWNPIITSACNLPVDRVAAATALHVFQQGFLGNRWSYTLGVPAVPLVQLYDPARESIETRGGEVHLGVAAKAIAFAGDRVSGIVTDNGLIEAAAVIAAVPFDRLDKLISNSLRKADARLRQLDRFAVSPILGVHLRFETEVMPLPHLILTDSPTQWLFNKGVDDAGRQHIHAVISAADEWMACSEEKIVEQVTRDIHSALPGSVGLRPVTARAVKEKRATFAATPGLDSIRPSAAPQHVGGGVKNLYLAGDWIDTGWPATMEGATRSGYQAAAAITGQHSIAADVPPGWLARALSRGSGLR